MPKALMDFMGYDIYFWSNEQSGNKLEPIHVHIGKGTRTQNATKIWITKDGVELEHNKSKIPYQDLKDLMKYISHNRNDIIANWYKHFGM